MRATLILLLSMSCWGALAQVNQMDLPPVKRQRLIQQAVVDFCTDKKDGDYHFSKTMYAYSLSENDSVNCHCVSNKPHGPWQLYVDKIKIIDGFFNEGLEDGEWTFFHRNGKVDIKTYIKKGVMHGPTKSWYETGELLKTKNYVNGLLQGPDITYHEDGNPWISVTYKDGKYHGKFQQWLSGREHQLYFDLNFYNGKLHGKQIYYHSNGIKFMEVIYKHDKLVSGKSWNEKGVEIPYDSSHEPTPRYERFF